jgi:hypothetical protein
MQLRNTPPTVISTANDHRCILVCETNELTGDFKNIQLPNILLNKLNSEITPLNIFCLTRFKFVSKDEKPEDTMKYRRCLIYP